MPHYFLGVDIGSTQSRALIADDSGRACGFGEAGPGNHEHVGYEGLAETIQLVTRRALAAASISKTQLAGAGFGIAGYDWPGQRAATLNAIQSLELGDLPLELVNDALIGLLAGAAAGWGVAVVAGTHSNCWGWDQQRRAGRMTGVGVKMGELAGGSELVEKAVEMVARQWTRRGPRTRLTERLIELTGARDAEDLLEGLTLQRYCLDAAAAPVVFQVAAAGDPVALELILWVGRELGSLAIGVIRQLGFETLTFEVILLGGLYNGSPLIIETMRQTIQTVAPGAHLIRLTVPPVIGGVLLGMEQAGLNALTLRETLIKSTVELFSL